MQAQCPRYGKKIPNHCIPALATLGSLSDSFTDGFPLSLPPFPPSLQFRVPATAKPGGYCMVPIPPVHAAQPAFGGGGGYVGGGGYAGGPGQYGGGYGGGGYQQNNGGGMSNFAAGAAGGLGGYLLADALFDGGDCGGDFGGGDW